VLGTREPADKGELIVLASGPDEAIDAAAHIFDAVGSRTLKLGDAGAGTRCKLIVNSKAMMSHSFDDPAFPLSLSRKDSELVLAAAEQEDLPTPVLRAVAERLARAERDGHSDEDMAATYLATAPGG
jgi:3-hydroxyisobutyrate dehydrogenase